MPISKYLDCYRDTGIKGNAFYFSGTEKIYSTLDNTVFDGDFSISVWAYFLDNNEGIILDSSNLSTATGGISLIRNSSGFIVFTHYNETVNPLVLTSSSAAPINTWMNIVVTWDNSDHAERYLIIDKVVADSDSGDYAVGVEIEGVYLTAGGCGTVANIDHRLVGYLKNIKVIDKILSSAEIEENYIIDCSSSFLEVAPYLSRIDTAYNYWKMDAASPTYPDGEAGTFDFENFILNTSYTISDASYNLLCRSEMKLISNGQTSPILHKSISTIPNGTKVMVRLKVNSGTIANLRVGKYGEALSNYQSVSLTQTNDWQIATITLNRADINNIGVCPNDGAVIGNSIDVDWIYVGDGSYSYLLVNSGTSATTGTFTDLTVSSGVLENSLYFNGSTSKVELSPTFVFGSDKTVMFWAKVGVNNITNSIFGGNISGDGSVRFVNSSLTVTNTISGSSTWTDCVFADSKFHHYALVQSSTNLIFFLDGIPNLTVPSYTGTINIERIGNSASNYFTGYLNGVYNINYALSAEEIKKYVAFIKYRVDRNSHAMNSLNNGLVSYIKDNIDIKAEYIRSL